MKQSRSLAPYEIRIIKIGRNAILNLTWEILSKTCYEKFRLPRGINRGKRICVDWCFDAERGEMILFAHSSMYKLNLEAAITYINNLSVEATDSFLLNPDEKDDYFSILDTSFEIIQPDTNIAAYGNRLEAALGKLHAAMDHRIRPLEEHEIRVIRLSQQAIQELVWEYFMKNGDRIMDIPEECGTSIIFHMHIEGKLEKLTLYAINLNEASDLLFEKVDAYCDREIGLTTDSLLKKPEEERYYISASLSKPFQSGNH